MIQATTKLPIGIFPVLTRWNEIMGGYEDERSSDITFQDPITGEHRVTAVVILSGPANQLDKPGMRAQSLSPEGFSLRLFLNDGTPWVEVTTQPGK